MKLGSIYMWNGKIKSHLAKHVANADSGTCGPHTGSNPLHFVLAFWRAALSHSSRPRANLQPECGEREPRARGQVRSGVEEGKTNENGAELGRGGRYLTAARWQS